MSQKTRPDQDISTGSWSNAPFYPKLSGTQAGGSGIKSAAGTPGDTFEVGLAPLAGTCCAPATLSVALRKNEAGSLPTSMALLQGDMVIAGQEVEPSQSFGSVDLTLSAQQVCKITDPTALSVRITAGRPPIGCCSDIPALLIATIHNVVDCDVLEGVTVPLCWNGAIGEWRGAIDDVCLMTLSLVLRCTGSNYSDFTLAGNWTNNVLCTIPFSGVPIDPPSKCSPLLLRFRPANVSVGGNCPCCANTSPLFDVDITQ